MSLPGITVRVFGKNTGDWRTRQNDEEARWKAFSKFTLVAEQLGIGRIFLPFCPDHNGIVADPSAGWKTHATKHTELFWGVSADAVALTTRNHHRTAVMFPSGGCPILTLLNEEDRVVYVIHCSRNNLLPDKGNSVLDNVIAYHQKSAGKKNIKKFSGFGCCGIRPENFVFPSSGKYAEKNKQRVERINRHWPGKNICGPETDWEFSLYNLIKAQLDNHQIPMVGFDQPPVGADPNLFDNAEGKERSGVFVIV